MSLLTRARLPIASPCQEDFGTMSKQGASSHCQRCSKSVHDLSAMTRAEAGAFLAQHQGGRVCVRYRAAADGSLRLRSPPPLATGGILVAFAGLMAACAGHAEPLALQTPDDQTCSDHAGYSIPCEDLETLVQIDRTTKPVSLPPGVPQPVESCPLPDPAETVMIMGDIAPAFTDAEIQQIERDAEREQQHVTARDRRAQRRAANKP